MTAASANRPTAEIPNDPIVNISCYKFVPLDDLAGRRDTIRARAAELDLRGTVLLSREGINLFVAGTRSMIDQFVNFLRADPLLSDLQPKESLNQYKPFSRLLVKIKREIIAFGVQSVDPVRRTSPKLPAKELKQWLDEGRVIHLLDVRNTYESDLGTFDGAIRMPLDHFRDFPQAVARLPESLKQQPVVMFCTGGIRCEKAGPYLEQAGFSQVYQLDGGILKYFEEVGGDHYDGECFVFDQRVAVDPALRETTTTQCYVCQQVVTPEDQQSERYVPGRSCPACYRDEAQRMADRLAERHRQVRQLTAVLPGSQPWFNRRPLNVPERFAGRPLLDFLDEWHPQVGRPEWLRRIQEGLIVPGKSTGRSRRRRAITEPIPLSPDRIVREGERFEHLQPESTEPDVNGDIRFLYEDDDYIVISKPAPLPMHACGRFHRNTLRHFINAMYSPERPHMVHRLDANTSGVLLMCRRQRIARLIQPQFENRTVSKVYLARVHGHPVADHFLCQAPLGREAEHGGVREPGHWEDDTIGNHSREAMTQLTVIARSADGTSLIEARPITGRTNQIRAHLWSCGFPICGDPAYLPDGQLGVNRTLHPDEPPMHLHAASIRFRDSSGNDRRFETPLPDWY